MKKHLLIIAILWLFSWASFAQTVATEPSGNGTEGTPYQIETLANLLWITENSEHWDKYYLQTADIDATETASWNEGEGWVPIGTEFNPFSGCYNGDGHTITGLTINRPEQNFVGLFGRLQIGTFASINLVDVNVIGSRRVGGLVGQATLSSLIQECSVSGEVKGKSFPGGIAGNLYYGSRIGNSHSTANIELLEDEGSQQAGGLIGRLLEGHIYNCYSTGDVSGYGSYFGGLVAIVSHESSIINSYSTGNVEGNNLVGGLIGSLENSSLAYSYSTGRVTSNGTAGGMLGRVIDASANYCYWNIETSGQSISTGGEAKTTVQMIQQATFEDWDFTSVWSINSGETYPYHRWQGAPSDFNYPPSQLRPTNLTAEQNGNNISLTWDSPSTGDMPDGYNIYRNDELLTYVSGQTSYSDNDLVYYTNYIYEVRAVYGSELSLPTNKASAYYFPGFNGGDGSESAPYEIANAQQLNAVRYYADKHFIQTDNIDLGVSPWNEGEGWAPIGISGTPFTGGYNGNYFEIQNITIDRPTVGLQGLFGYTYGANLRCIITVNAQVAGMNSTGAIVGQAYLSRIENCYSSGNITGSYYVGGIIGFSNNTELLSQCFSNASVSGDNTIGGIAGVHQASSKIINSYCVGEISGGDNIGGLVGILTLGGIVENSFFAGTITGNSALGGLVGSTPNGYVQNSYWDTQTTDLYESAGGTGKTTAEMNNIATFLNGGWDFKGLGAEDIWNIGNDRNIGYPYLNWRYPTDDAISIEILPSAVIEGVMEVTHSSAVFNVDVTNIGNPQGTLFGVCWSSSNTEPTTDDEHKYSTEEFALGKYTVNAEDLSPLTTYYARAFATNANGTAYSDTYGFTTECGPQTLPIIENFDNSYQMPQCWKTWATNSGGTYFLDGYAYSDPNMVYLHMPNTSSTAYLISPEIDADISSLQVTFMAMNYWNNDMILEVGTMSNPADASTFSYFAHIQTQGSYAQEYVAFDSYSGTDKHIAFRVSSNIQNQTGYVFIDDVTIKTVTYHNVTFNVDMTNASNFDPNSDIVYFTGNMFNWAEPGFDPEKQAMSRVEETMVWTKTLQLPEGTYEYNYFLNGGWDTREPIYEYRRVSVFENISLNDNWGQYGLQFVSPSSADAFDVCDGTINISISAEGVGEVNGDIYFIDTWGSWNWVTSYYSNGNGTTNYTYNIPLNLQPGQGQFFLWANNEGTYSDFFTITNNSKIIFTEPLASQSYEVGLDTDIPVELTLDGCIGRCVELYFDNNGNWVHLEEVCLDNESTTYLTSYSIPGTILSGSYRFAYQYYSNTIWDWVTEYSEYFTINNPNVTLSFTSPTASDTYEVGVDNNIPIEVEYAGLGYMYFNLYISDQNDGWKHITSFSDENDGVFNHNHTLTSNYTSGSYQYKLIYEKDESTRGEILSDEFIIVNNQEFLELTRPQFEFEDPSFYTPDGSIEIRWNSNALTNVDIHYSLDNGFSWTIIEGNLNTEDGNTYNGNNSYYWDIPGDISGTYDQCKIRVRNSADHGLTSESGLFTISSEDPVTFSSPIAGTTIETGGPLTITMDVLSESWVSLYIQGQYNTYGIAGISATVGTNTVTTDDTYMLSTGTYRVMAYHNNSGTQAYSDEFTVTCPTVTLPLTENFDRTSNIPGCWFTTGLNYNMDITGCNGRAYSQPNSARLYHGMNGHAILSTPEITQGLNGLRVRCKSLLATDPVNGTLFIGTMSDPTDGNTFNVIESFELTNRPGDDWQSIEVWIDEYLGSDKHIAFKLGDGTSENWSRAFIDNIIIDEIPSCVEPFNLAVGTLTQTSAEISWTEPETSTQWDIIYGAKGFNPLTQGELVAGVTQNPYTLEDLNHSSEYEFYVRTYCGGTPSGWSTASTFTTECGPIEITFVDPQENQTFDFSVSKQIPYTFNYRGCDEVWTNTYMVDELENESWYTHGYGFSNTETVTYSYNAPATLPSGTYKFRIDYWHNEQTSSIYSNEFEVVNNASVIEVTDPNSWSYWNTGLSYGISWNSLNVSGVNLSYSLDNGSTWSSIANGIASQNGYNYFNFEVPVSISGHFEQSMIRVEDAENSSVVSYSEKFTISSTPLISFIEPNALSHIEVMGEMDITIVNQYSSWIDFHLIDNEEWFIINQNNFNQGQSTFTYNTYNLEVGKTYRLYAYHYNNGYGAYSEYFTLSKATPTITEWPTASGITYGEALSASSLTEGYAGHNSTEVEGTFSFDSPSYVPAAGSYLANVTFTPTNSETYSTVSGTVEVGVAKADPEISVWPVASAITYGEAISQSTISGGTVDVAGTFSFDSPATKPNAGTYAADVTFTPTDNANYNTVMGSVDITVNTAPLTIIANSFSKQAGTDYVFAGDEFTTDPLELIGSDEVTSVTISSDGSASTAAEGDYPTVPSSAMGSGLGNYSITYQNGTLSVVNKTILTIEGLTIVEKEYDGTRNAAVLSWGNLTGFEETFEDVQLDITNAVIHFDNKNAGNNKTVIVSGLALTGEIEWMYSINDQIVSGNILQKPLTITAPNCNKTYGETDPEVTVSYNGFIAGENESILEGTLAITREPGEDVDTYTITPAGLSSNNYSITFQTGLLTINAKELFVTANDAEKIYGSNDPALNVSYTGFEFTDDETVFFGELAISRETGEDVNTYLITPSGLSASNYSLSYVNGTFTITPKTLTITAENKTKVYGSDDPAFSIEYSGFAAADDLSSLSGTLEFSRDAGENVGTYAIVPSGYSSTNYTIGYTPGALSITPKLLTISANNASKVYGTSDPAFTVSYTGFIAGEDKTVLNGTLGTNRESGETVANYVITPSGLSSTNYTISYATGLLSITAKELTVGGSFTTSNREYDGTNAATISANSLTLQGVITSDEVTLNPAVAFDNKNTGTSKVVSLVSATTLAGIDAGNYALTLTGAPTATANITAKELTVTGAIAASKVYDGTTNAIISGATLSGVIGSDVVNLGNATTGTFAQKFVGADVAVTTAITISGTDAGNYTVSQPSDLQANITTKELTIEGSFTVHDKEYDGNTTATINENNLTLAGSISGDEISLTDITIAFANADIGDDKTVSITTATLGGAEKNNYTLSLEDSPTTTASITVSTTTYTVTYSVVGGNGSLAATVDDSPINSGDEILATKAVEFTATPLEGYRVKRWTNNGTTVAGNTTNSYTVSGILQNTSVTVEFEEIPPVVYTLTLVVSPANAGTVTGEGEYEAAEQVTIKASPAEGFVFTGWTGNVAEPLDATTTFTMPAEDATVTANFEPEQPETFTVTFTVKSNTQEPIEDAEISVDSEVITTNSNGEASTSLANGSYTYSVTATGYEEHSGNFSVSGANKSIAITLVAVGYNVELLSDVEIYPNPFDQKIVIKGIEGVQRIAITNVAGQLIKNIKISNETEITIGAGNISAGTYIVTLYFTNGDIQNRKIVKVN
ncbi:MBG domain-containing protein [Perlabentimonas gracilis]|uniref:MBG domain-containing protein n=1 Tax=Perlabentimonas gracilis TaxID=2715279 RepID=UPI00140AD83D|nr:MBG domain-containing protein [Perlabentimonas gracilis]NHB69041.1 T9SS type A sorting domain-containing protein [Perlabentimonas gracilis]